MNIQEIEYILVKELPIIMRNNETVRQTIMILPKGDSRVGVNLTDGLIA